LQITRVQFFVSPVLRLPLDLSVEKTNKPFHNHKPLTTIMAGNTFEPLFKLSNLGESHGGWLLAAYWMVRPQRAIELNLKAYSGGFEQT